MTDAEIPDKNREVVEEFIHNLFGLARNLRLTDEEIEHYTKKVFGKGQWDNIAPLIKESERKTEALSDREAIEYRLREKFITGFVDQYVQERDKYERDRVSEEIRILEQADRSEDLRAYLLDVLAVGHYKSWQKNLRQFGGGGYVRYAWEAVKGLIRVAIVLGILFEANSKFETILFAALILIFNSVEGTLMTYQMGALRQSYGIGEQLKGLRRLIIRQMRHDFISVRYGVLPEEDTLTALRSVNRIAVLSYIHGSFIFITSMIALWKLAVAIW